MTERISTWAELQAWIERRTADFSSDYLGDAQALSADARQRSLGKVALLAELRVLVARRVAAEGRRHVR